MIDVIDVQEDGIGRTALHHAAQGGSRAICEFLIAGASSELHVAGKWTLVVVVVVVVVVCCLLFVVCCCFDKHHYSHRCSNISLGRGKGHTRLLRHGATSTKRNGTVWKPTPNKSWRTVNDGCS